MRRIGKIGQGLDGEILLPPREPGSVLKAPRRFNRSRDRLEVVEAAPLDCGPQPRSILRRRPRESVDQRQGGLTRVWQQRYYPQCLRNSLK